MRNRRPAQPSDTVALARVLTPLGHPPLTTLAEATAYMLALPAGIASRQAWEHAAEGAGPRGQYPAELAMAARTQPDAAAIAALTRQLEVALFTTYRLDVEADR